MGFCVVDWGGKDLGLESVRRGIWWWLRGLGALCAPRGWDYYSRAAPAPPAGRRIDAAFCGSAFVTGYAGDASEFESFGDHDVLRKPFTLNALEQAIRRCGDARAPERIAS